MFQQKYLSQKTCQEHEILLVELEGRDREQQLLINQMKVDVKIKEAIVDRLKAENAKLKDKLEEMEEEVKLLEGELRKVESLEEMEEMIAVVKQKNERVEELEEALRQSVAITSDIETEKKQDRSKMMQITDKLEKLEHKLQRAKDLKTKEGPCPECPELRHKLKQTTEELAAMVAERRKHLEELFHMKHDALMSALSEKDAHLALLEESGLRTARAQQEYKRLTQARAAVLRAIQRQDESQVKQLAELSSSSSVALPRPPDFIPSMEIYRSEKTPSTEGDDDVFTPPKATQDDVLSPADRSSSQSSEDSITMPDDSDHEEMSICQQKNNPLAETSITHRPLKIGDFRAEPDRMKFADDGAESSHQLSQKFSAVESRAKSGVNLEKQSASHSSTSDPKSQVPKSSCTSEDFLSASIASSSTLYHSLSKDDHKPGCSSTRESVDTLAETDFFSLSENTTLDSWSTEAEARTAIESLSTTEVDTADTSSASEAGSLLDLDRLDDEKDFPNPKLLEDENDGAIEGQVLNKRGSQVKLRTPSNLFQMKASCSSPAANPCGSLKEEIVLAPSESASSTPAATLSSHSSKDISSSASRSTDKKCTPSARASAQRTESRNKEFLTEL